MWEERVGNALGNTGVDCAVWREWYRPLRICKIVYKDVRETRKEREKEREGGRA